MDPTSTPPPVVTAGGSLGLLAAGHRGLAAWRAARAPDWIDALGLPPMPEKPTDEGADETRAEGSTPAAP